MSILKRVGAHTAQPDTHAHRHTRMRALVDACAYLFMIKKCSYYDFFWNALDFPNHLSLTLAFCDNKCRLCVFVICSTISELFPVERLLH